MQITLNNADIRAMDQKVLQTSIMLVGQGILNAARKYGCFDEYHNITLDTWFYNGDSLPQSPVQTAVLNGFGHMARLNLRFAFEVCDGAARF